MSFKEVSVQTLFLKGYWLLFVEIKSSVYILKQVLYQIHEFAIISPRLWPELFY